MCNGVSGFVVVGSGHLVVSGFLVDPFLLVIVRSADHHPNDERVVAVDETVEAAVETVEAAVETVEAAVEDTVDVAESSLFYCDPRRIDVDARVGLACCLLSARVNIAYYMTT